MPSHYPAFKSFTSGEISPRMYARSDLPMYHHAVAKAENFNITPQGSAILRRGWRHLADAETLKDVRLLTFSRALGEDIVIALSSDSIQAFNSSGDIIVDVGEILGPPVIRDIETVSNGSFDGFTSWSVYNYNQPSTNDPRYAFTSGGWAGLHYILTADLQTENTLRQTLTKPTVGTPTTNLLRVTGHTKLDASLFPNWLGVYPFSFGWKCTIYESNGTTVIETKSGSIAGAFAMTPVDMTSRTSVVVELESFSGATVARGVMFSGISGLFQVQEQASAEGEFPWADDEIKWIQYQMLTGQDAMILVERNTLPYQLIYNESTNRLKLEQVIFTGAPPWAEDDSVGVVEIFQGRLWLMSTKSDPSGIWASKSGELLDFTIGTGANDAMYLPLATKGVIQWAVGQRRTISIGTDLGENILSSAGQILTPSDASADQVSAYGSTFIQASMIGDQILFVSPDARKLLATIYDDNTQNWTATELSWAAQHLMVNHVVRFLDVRNPDYQLVCATLDGYWIQCLYDRVLGLIGWQRNSMQGQIVSMCSTKSIDGDVVWAAIRRDNKMSINRIESTLEPRIHLDYWARRFPKEDAEGWYVDGLEHLAENNVSILADGALLLGHTVTELGVLRLPKQFSEAYVGLPYTGTLVMLPEEPTDNVESLSGGKKRNNNITVRLVDSAMPKINGKRPADRSPTTPMDTREPNVTTDINVRSLGWDGQGLITIEQDKPFRTEVVGIFTKLNTNRT